MASVGFKKGTKAEYASLQSPDNNTLYVCTDTGESFLGSIPLSATNITTQTDTNITGILKGTGTKVAQATAGTDYVTPNSLATVATSGDYTDLINKPTGLMNIVTETSGSSKTISTAVDNTVYRYGTLTSLTVSAFPAGTLFQFFISFKAGASISVTITPSTSWKGGAAPSWTAGKYYEISISNGGYCVATEWNGI